MILEKKKKSLIVCQTIVESDINSSVGKLLKETSENQLKNTLFIYFIIK